MKGRITSYRRGRKTQNNYQMLIRVIGYHDKNKSSQLIGKKVVWKTKSGKEIKGKILATHGNNGLVRARFKKALPGQAIGTFVEVLE